MSDVQSPLFTIETSRSDRAAPLCGAAGAGGKNARREATNSGGAGSKAQTAPAHSTVFHNLAFSRL